jgi:DNA-binding PadR family transcriptional regulator
MWIYPHREEIANITAEEVYMGDQTRGPEEYLPLTPAMLDIVVALADDELHGYAIMREVRRRTDGRKRLAPGTLYRSLRQMQERGLVAESDERPEAGLDDERRRYYRLTGLGRRVALAEVERLEDLVQAARSKGLAPSARPSGATAGA